MEHQRQEIGPVSRHGDEQSIIYWGGIIRDEGSERELSGVKSWSAILPERYGFSLEIVTLQRCLQRIDAVPTKVGLLKGSETQRIPLYDQLTVEVALAHEWAEARGSTDIFADGETGQVVGTATDWAEAMGLNAANVEDKLVNAPAVRRVRTRPFSRIYTQLYAEHVIRDIFPNAFEQPAWQARIPGRLILPTQNERYVVLDNNLALRYRGKIRSIIAKSVQNRPAEYFSESDLAQARGRAIPTLTSEDYDREIALSNPHSDLGTRLAQLRTLAAIKQAAPEVELTDRGTVELNGRTQAPRPFSGHSQPVGADERGEWIRARQECGWRRLLLMKVYPLESKVPDLQPMDDGVTGWLKDGDVISIRKPVIKYTELPPAAPLALKPWMVLQEVAAFYGFSTKDLLKSHSANKGLQRARAMAMHLLRHQLFLSNETIARIVNEIGWENGVMTKIRQLKHRGKEKNELIQQEIAVHVERLKARAETAASEGHDVSSVSKRDQIN